MILRYDELWFLPYIPYKSSIANRVVFCRCAIFLSFYDLAAERRLGCAKKSCCFSLLSFIIPQCDLLESRHPFDSCRRRMLDCRILQSVLSRHCLRITSSVLSIIYKCDFTLIQAFFNLIRVR